MLKFLRKSSSSTKSVEKMAKEAQKSQQQSAYDNMEMPYVNSSKNKVNAVSAKNIKIASGAGGSSSNS